MFFLNLRFGLLVGVAAGLPNLSQSLPRDIRLGDVLVALPKGDSAGLIAYELGKEVGENTIQLLYSGHVLSKMETVIRSAIGKIELKAPKYADVFLPHYQRIQDEEHANGTSVDPGQDWDAILSYCLLDSKGRILPTGKADFGKADSGRPKYSEYRMRRSAMHK
ncbi:hypothetical protein B0J13DRAFT_524432 [Dactylonectria estremocensis]|uniref:Uncharacterized protein n=1 Tax=Dactylonectria estremocensis TaxID=1079267 RepID=A0A9P9J812_9HYPO|nr:hypothetical protein B0J13DRAFT_524432 [Dactylonectria estremocensis]